MSLSIPRSVSPSVASPSSLRFSDQTSPISHPYWTPKAKPYLNIAKIAV